MRALGRHPTLRRHPGVSERMRASEFLERERLRELLGKAGLLVDLDHLPGAHHPQVGPLLTNPRLRFRRVRLDDEHRVARTHRSLVRGAERLV